MTKNALRLASHQMTFKPLLCVLALGVSSGAAMAASPNSALLAHRAVYDLELGQTTGNSAPSNARGRIVFEFSGSACEGYVTTFRQITEISLQENQGRISDMRTSTFEDGDGKNFRFKTNTLVDGRQSESLDGSAHRSDDGALSVKMSKPQPAKFDVSMDVVFPTAQLLQIIKAAQAGEATFGVKIFDGSDPEGKVYDTLTVIGHASDAPINDDAATKSEALKGINHWPVAVSYFDPEKKDGTPNYVLSFDLFANGVSGNLKLDYGDYVLNGKLSKFEPIAQKPCKP